MKYGVMEHFSHPGHNLELAHRKTPYKCDGCLEVGYGARFRCDAHNYDLHRECADAHPFIKQRYFKGCVFEFLQQPPGHKGRFCDACGRDIKGFVYHGKRYGWDLHPCCTNFPVVIKNDEVELRVRKKVSSKCHRCGTKKVLNGGRGLWYVSTCGEYRFHVACMKDLIVESLETGYFVPNGNSDNNNLELGNLIPNMQMMRINNGGNEGRMNKYWRIAKLVLKFIISAILGDPTTVVASLVISLV